MRGFTLKTERRDVPRAAWKKLDGMMRKRMRENQPVMDEALRNLMLYGSSAVVINREGVMHVADVHFSRRK